MKNLDPRLKRALVALALFPWALVLGCVLAAHAVNITKPTTNVTNISGGGADPTKLPLTGGTITGPVTMSSAPLIMAPSEGLSDIRSSGGLYISSVTATELFFTTGYADALISDELDVSTAFIARIDTDLLVAPEVDVTTATLWYSDAHRADADFIFTPFIGDGFGANIRFDSSPRLTVNSAAVSSVDAAVVIDNTGHTYHLGTTAGPVALFGGAYTTCSSGGSPCQQTNPLSGSCSCPAGFTAQTMNLLGTGLCDSGSGTVEVYYCYQR